MAKNQDDAESSPVPSITLQITKRDGERFLEASNAVAATIAATETAQSLHIRLFEACQKCKHPLVAQFLERTSHLSETEKHSAALIFHDSDKSSKLRELFGILSTTNESNRKDGPSLTRGNVTSLFRAILSSITACIQCYDLHGEDNVIVEGQPTSDRPLKRARLNHEGATTVTKDESVEDAGQLQPAQSNSWDSSLATTRDDDDSVSGMRKEVEDVANYASNDVFEYANSKSGGSASTVDFLTFGNWYNENGGSIVPWIELLRLAKWKAAKTNKSSIESNKENAEKGDGSHHISTVPDDGNRTLISFDFNGSGNPDALIINISEDNIMALSALVSRTGLMHQHAADVCRMLSRYACIRSVSGQEMMILRRNELFRTLNSLIPQYFLARCNKDEKDSFIEALFDLFKCFEGTRPFLHHGEVDLKEFAVGFCFLCAGNKSSKLAAGFEYLDSKNRGYLTEDQLLRYLQSYLTMLVGMSLLLPHGKQNQRKVPSVEEKRAIRQALEHGAKWTLSHFLKSSGQTRNEYSFEVFAAWYSSGGFNIAPWLELLDLNKIMSLTSATESLSPPKHEGRDYRTAEKRSRDRVSSLRRHHQATEGPPPEILFTFPLGNRRSLVLLKEDALYVSGVVEQLGLWNLKPDDLWVALSTAVDRRQNQHKRPDVAVFVSQKVFTESMMDICPKPNRKRPAPGSSMKTNLSTQELISNFFQCFDIEQTDRVALDELMGGLTLLCGGKKSQKLSFAFSIFDTRPGMHGPTAKKRGTAANSLSGEDLFLFLRSVLIVTFSTCRQSLDMSDETVGRFIADAANMICNDVMRHQWETKRADRVDFDEFGQWYNDGGFERAPWLELLDLQKWVVFDDGAGSTHQVAPRLKTSQPIPPPPPDDALDNTFFDTEAIMPIDSMDDMDMILMQGSHDQHDFPRITKSFSYTNSPRSQGSLSRPPESMDPLKFHINTDDPHGGFAVSLSKVRVAHFQHVISQSKLHLIETEEAFNKFLSNGPNSMLSKEEFDKVVESILPTNGLEEQSRQILSDIFNIMYKGFDRDNKDSANAIEIACGFIALCRGKKSEKLQFAYEVFENTKKCQLSKDDVTNYLRSFLVGLLSIAFAHSLNSDPSDDNFSTANGLQCERTIATLKNVASDGAQVASSAAFVFHGNKHSNSTSMCFDDFADWYTNAGHSSIPWLELLDLQKWAMADKPAT